MLFFVKEIRSNILFLYGSVLLSLMAIGPVFVSGQSKGTAVVLAEDPSTYTLSNSYVTARISKQSGDLVSLKYKDHELLEAGSGHAYAYWSHAPAKDGQIVDSATIDPAKNGGDRGEVSIKGFYNEKLSNAQGPPSSPKWEEVANMIDDDMQSVMFGKSSPQQAAADMQQKAASIGS